MQVQVDHIDEVASGIRMFWFATENIPKYKAGQFTELFLPHKPKDNRGNKRWFTLSSSPTEPCLAITTKFAKQNGSSFKAALADVKPGDKLHLAFPMGDFVLPDNAKQKLVLVAGGIGVTPFRSMIKSLVDSGEHRDITLLYAVNSPDELAFTDLFEHSFIRFVPIVSEAGENWHGLSGRIDAKTILDYVEDKRDTRIYLSGPEPMIKSLVKDLKLQGVSGGKLMTDFFPGYGEA